MHLIIQRSFIILVMLMLAQSVFSQTAPNINYSGSQTFTTGTAITPLTSTNSGGAVAVNGQTTTLAGSTTPGYTNGTGTAAKFNHIEGIAMDASGNVYVSDAYNSVIRKITPAGAVTTFAGSGSPGAADGSASSATFHTPSGLAVDVAGNVYVADAYNNLVRKITPAGVVSTLAGSIAGFADGQGTAAKFNSPVGCAVDAAGNVYVTESQNNRVRKITPSGYVSTLAGNGVDGTADGTGTAATFYSPLGITIGPSGNIYVADWYNHRIRKITPAGVVTTLAGSTAGWADGTGSAAKFNYPVSIIADANENLYVADEHNHMIRMVTPAGVVTTIAGTGTAGSANGTGNVASFYYPFAIAVDNTGYVYVGEYGNSMLRKVAVANYTITPALPAGLNFNTSTGVVSGTPTAAATASPTVTAYNSYGMGATTLNITVNTLAAPNISYTSPQTFTAGQAVSPLTPTNSGGAVSPAGQTITLAGASASGYVNGAGTAARFANPASMAVDATGNIYVSDMSNDVIRKITPAGVVTTFAGSGVAGATDGPGTSASFYNPDGLAFDASGNLFVADLNNSVIRKITPGGTVSTFAGNNTLGYLDGIGTAASFTYPRGIVFDASGNMFVSDQGNNVIRKITPAGVVTTFVGSGASGAADGTGSAASFTYLRGMAIDPAGNIYALDYKVIRKITPAGVVTTLAGAATGGWMDGTGTSAGFLNPFGITMDSQGMLYVADNYLVRKVTPAGVVTTLAGALTGGLTDGTGSAARFYGAYGAAADRSGNIYICEQNFNNAVRKIIANSYVISPALPAGLNFDNSTGVITGTPTAASAATAYTITANNITGSSSTTLSITVNPSASVNASANQNYIITYTPRIAGLTTPAAVVTASGDQTQVETAIQYLDGLGRLIQTVQVKGSPKGSDMIQPIAYDQFGREATKYLPYALTGTAISDGSYKATALTDQNTFYNTPPSGVSAITNPVSQVNFEPSPLNRVVEQGAPGIPWQLSTSGINGSGHTIKMVYALNNSIAFSSDSINGRQVALYNTTINTDGSQTMAANGFYNDGQLTVTISGDENWVSGRAGTVEEYKDKEGHVVLKRQYNYAKGLQVPSTYYVQVLSTYYIYDDMERLAFVLPPLAGGDADVTPAQTTLDNLCYQYRYDERGRLSQKKLPGKGWEYTVYNTIDQPVATQDANEQANNNWLFTKYDAMGRPVLTGIWNNGNTGISQAALQGTLTGINTNLWESVTNNGNGYTNVAWPTISTTATLDLNYYDSYANIPSLPATYTQTTGISNMTRGLTVAKKTAVLNTPTDQLWDVIYYDDLGRTTQSYAQHYLNGTLSNGNYDAITTTYNFTNAPTTVTRQHWNSTNTTTPLVTIANQYIYDHMGRKLKTWEQITNGGTSTPPVMISALNYNEIGQVSGKHLHGTTADSVNGLQTIAYTYNERGWLVTSSAPWFAMQLYYNTGTNKQYNGNIMYQYWGTPGSLTNNYSYAYDKLNRLTSGVSTLNNNESGITYDLNGNITALNRYQANVPIDQLAYTYNNTNQLQTIVDNSGNDGGLKHGTWNYTYDPNGNLTTDPSKGTSGISIAYNMLNLPKSITGSKTITYVYDAMGNKLRRVSPVTGSTDYIAGIQYDQAPGATSPTLSFMQTEEGKAVPSTSGYNYTYYLTDNLGNTRVTFDTGTGSAQKVQADDYYPFGMEIPVTTNGAKNEYLYNKKELQEELNEYDYGARMYDPVIARWNTIDPLAEVSRRWSPYNYVEDDPVRFTDPDGMSVKTDSAGNTNYKGKDAKNYLRGLQAYDRKLKLKSDVTKTNSKTLGLKPLTLKSPSQAPNFHPSEQPTLSTYNPAGPVNNQDIGNPNTALSIAQGVEIGYSMGYGAAALINIKNAIWGTEAADFVINGETSATKLGKEMHALYKVGEADGINTFKEFTGVKGIRPDFVDFESKTIFELKPNNIRAIRQGYEQLNNYKSLFEKQYGGTWKVVLDTY